MCTASNESVSMNVCTYNTLFLVVSMHVCVMFMQGLRPLLGSKVYNLVCSNDTLITIKLISDNFLQEWTFTSKVVTLSVDVTNVLLPLKGVAWNNIYFGRYYPTLSLYKAATVSLPGYTNHFIPVLLHTNI